MFGLTFARPVGAAADVSELQYIVALHQTSHQTRSNGTVSSQDIRALLQSRYGLTISHAQAVQVVHSLGGGDTTPEPPPVPLYPRSKHDSDDEDNNNNNPKQVLEHIWKAALNGLKKPFHVPDTDGGASASEQETRQTETPSGGAVPAAAAGAPAAADSVLTNVSAGTALTLKTLLNQLHRLHSGNQQGVIDDRSLLILQDKVAEDLKDRVMHKTLLQKAAAADDESPLQAAEPAIPENSLPIIVENSAKEEVESPAKDGEEQALDKEPSSDLPLPVTSVIEASPSTATTVSALGASASDEDAAEPTALTERQPLMNESSRSVEASGDMGLATGRGHQELEEKEDGTASLTASFPAKVELEQGSQPVLGEPPSVFVDEEQPRNVDVEANDEKLQDEQEEEEPMAQFLDMVQILSTIMIPTLARIAHEAKTARQQHQTATAESGESTCRGPLSHCWTRFVAYGRRKLQIPDDSGPPLYSSREILQKSRLALLKSLPLSSGDDAPVVDASLVQLLLITHGEVERANNKELVQEMVAAAATSASGRFDEEALIHAISSDLQECWDPTSEDTPSTFFRDVFGQDVPTADLQLVQQRHPQSDTDIENLDEAVPGDDDRKKNGFFCSGRRPDFNTSLAALDFVVDNHLSRGTIVFSWVFFIMSIIIYGTLLIFFPDIGSRCKSTEFWCMILDTIYSWALIAILMSMVGLCFHLPLSVGNNPSNRSLRSHSISLAAAIFFALIPFIIVEELEDRKSFNYSVTGSVSARSYDIAQRWTAAVGCILAFLFALQVITLWMTRDGQRESEVFRRLASFSSLNAESSIYRAARRKVEQVVTNALRLHDPIGMTTRNAKVSVRLRKKLSRTRDETTRNFILHGERHEPAGGIIWTFWRYCDGSLFRHEGIWVHSRLLVIQTTQGLTGVFMAVFLFVLAERLANEADEYRDSFVRQYPDFIMDIFPTGSMVRGALMPAAVCATVIGAMVTILYIPSVVATILKFRGKLLPSLGSPYFERYRKSVDYTYMNMANAIYALLGSMVLFYIAIGGVIFLFLWPITSNGAIILLAWCLGLSITVGVKMLVTAAFRNIQYRRFYRTRPLSAKITSLALECWFLGVAGSVLLARVAQFLFAAAFWVGRTDVNFLSEDVRLFGYAFDYVPTHFIKDILVHEAHRHPYIERLSQMYLMKLRHGDRFNTNAGAVWRQLVVVAMLPWLAKYRVFGEERQTEGHVEAEEEQERRDAEATIYRRRDSLGKGIVRVGQSVQRETKEIGQEVLGAGQDAVADVRDALPNSPPRSNNKNNNDL